MEGAILSSQSNSRLRTHLKNAASVLCARTLPKQRRSDATSTTARHHTYPRVSPQKRAQLPCRLEPLICATVTDHMKPEECVTRPPCPDMAPVETSSGDVRVTSPDDVYDLRGAMAREVASVWGSRVGPPSESAPADRVQCLFNDIDLYPTKTQVFEMLVCARQCGRRKSLKLTFGEFCVFAAELRHYSRQASSETSKPDSPLQSTLKKYQEKAVKYFNGCEASSPPSYEIFLGGSCNPTTWRSDIAIPMLKELGITYFNPQVEDWSTELMEVEDRAKAAAQALLFVLDCETRAVAASVEAAHHATSPRDLLLVLRPYVRHQTIGHETITDNEYLELSRARTALQELVERRGLPVFVDIRAALRRAHAVLRRARTYPRRQLGQSIMRLKRAFDAAGGKAPLLPRARAIQALRDAVRAPHELADRYLPAAEHVDFETFCATVAEMLEAGVSRSSPAECVASVASVASEASVATTTATARCTVRERVRRALRCLRGLAVAAGASVHTDVRNGSESRGGATETGAAVALACNARLREYGRKLRLIIPKNGGHRDSGESADPSEAASGGAAVGAGEGGGAADSAGGEDSVLTPSTERRLEELPAMLGVPVRDVFLCGCFPSTGPRPEEVLRREGLTYTMPRPNDYTRMFSVPTRRAASSRPQSPRPDKMARASHRAAHHDPHHDDDVTLREREPTQPEDRLSASDFYSVSEDVTPQPFKGTYDEDVILGSRVLLFSMSAESPCFAPMVLAAHYMGLRPSATVLLVQPMDAAASHDYSAAAVKDYNRGRLYLADLAQRAGVPVFDSAHAALACVVSRLRVSPAPASIASPPTAASPTS